MSIIGGVYLILVGESLCYELSKNGALLIMSARSEQKMKTIKQSLKYPGNAKYNIIVYFNINCCEPTILYTCMGGS